MFNEIAFAVIDSDIGMLQMVCGECLKSIELFLNKIQGLIHIGPETQSITCVANVFNRNSLQEQNHQLYILLVDLKQGFGKFVQATIKTHLDCLNLENSEPLDDTNLNSLSSNKLSFGQESQECIQDFVQLSTKQIDTLIQNHLLSPIANLITKYSVKCLVELLNEQITVDSKTVKSSTSVLLLTSQLPNLIDTYFDTSLAPNLSNATIFSLICRIKMVFISVSCLIRPMSESVKLRIASDASALEHCLNRFQINVEDCASHELRFDDFFL